METTQNALTIVDGFDADASDPTASPIRGGNRRFKDASYFEFSERVDVDGKRFAVLNKETGWQKLEAGCPPEFLMRKPGEPRPPRPHVDEANWPKNFNGVAEHPWKYTTYLQMIDVDTGEVSTFSTNTIGGNIAVGELSDQISFMRRARPDAVPVIALDSKDMPTQYGGTKPRPYFKILGWRGRDDTGSQNLLTDQSSASASAPSIADDFSDALPDNLAPPKPAAKANGKRSKSEAA
jgi:hypothetical protein